MLIECRQRRDARPKKVGRKDVDVGSKARVFGKLYHFRPQADLLNGKGDPLAHVCVVEDPRAIERFLSIAEAYNEVGKPPRVQTIEAPPTVGQPPIKTELVDAGDKLGHLDSEPYVADPLAMARQLQAQWKDDMLDKAINDIVKEIPGLNDTELMLLYVGEQDGQKREELLKLLRPEQEAEAKPEPEPVEEKGETVEISME